MLHGQTARVQNTKCDKIRMVTFEGYCLHLDFVNETDVGYRLQSLNID